MRMTEAVHTLARYRRPSPAEPQRAPNTAAPVFSHRPESPTRARYEAFEDALVGLLDRAAGHDGPDASPAPTSPVAPSGAGEEVLTPGQQVALLKMRKSDWSKAVLKHIAALDQDRCDGADFRSCAEIGLAINKGSYHVLSNPGRWRADQLARAIAKANGMHVISTEIPKPSSGFAPQVRCTCGFQVRVSRYVPGWENQLSRAGHGHLRHVGATCEEVEAGAAP